MMRIMKPFLAACLVLVFGLAACMPSLDAPGADQAVPVVAVRETPPPIRAVTFDSRGRPPDAAFDSLRAHHVTHIAVTPFGWQESHDDPVVHLRPDARWYTEGDHGIVELAERARSHGIGLIVKPHIWLRRSAASQFYQGQEKVDKWRDEIGFVDEADWAAWEASYTTFMLHYARVAEAAGAEILVIGTELATAARARPAFWRRLAGEVRAVYGGQLTYAANWYREYDEVAFWDALDFVGIQAYFPLSDAPDPTLADLVDGWRAHCDAIDALRRRVGLPVLFTEIGYRSVPFAASTPWEWPSREDVGRVDPDPELQALLYEAFFQTFWTRTWTAGAIFWKWYPPAGEGESDRRRRREDYRALDFTPQAKPAARVMARWFRG